MSRHNITSSKISDLDETGSSTVYVCPKIICGNASKQVEIVENGTVFVELR